MNIKGMVKEIAQQRWNENKYKDGYTKEDALTYALEYFDGSNDYGIDYDPTEKEYQEILDSIVDHSNVKEYLLEKKRLIENKYKKTLEENGGHEGSTINFWNKAQLQLINDILDDLNIM